MACWPNFFFCALRFRHRDRSTSRERRRSSSRDRGDKRRRSRSRNREDRRQRSRSRDRHKHRSRSPHDRRRSRSRDRKRRHSGSSDDEHSKTKDLPAEPIVGQVKFVPAPRFSVNLSSVLLPGPQTVFWPLPQKSVVLEWLKQVCVQPLLECSPTAAVNSYQMAFLFYICSQQVCRLVSSHTMCSTSPNCRATLLNPCNLVKIFCFFMKTIPAIILWILPRSLNLRTVASVLDLLCNIGVPVTLLYTYTRSRLSRCSHFRAMVSPMKKVITFLRPSKRYGAKRFMSGVSYKAVVANVL